MTQQRGMAHTFERSIEALVAAKVQEGSRLAREARAPIIEFLRDLEAASLSDGQDRNVIQVIQSGRHLLGDTSGLGPVKQAARYS